MGMKIKKATFAAGCFWHVEEEFRMMEGVKSTTAGYTGGKMDNPTYEDVCSDRTGHAEAIEVEYDPKKISYSELLEKFWEIHNPTTLNRQGLDFGIQYRSAIFYHDEKQKKEALDSKQKLQKTVKYQNKKIVTEIVKASKFFKAEDYHQKYLLKRGKTTC